MTLRSSLNAAVRLPELSGRLAPDPQAGAEQPAMTVTVQVTLPHAAVEAARLTAPHGADSLEIAAHLAEGLHAMAASRAREVIPSAGVSTTVSMVTQSLDTDEVVAGQLLGDGGSTLVRSPGQPPTRRAAPTRRLFEPTWSLPAGAAAGEAPDAPSEAPTLVIIAGRREALLDHVPLVLTRREYELLVFLAERPGRVFTRRELLVWVWGEDVVSGERTVDVHVRRLRAKMRRRGPVITTIRGVGYRLDRAERVTVS